MGAAGPPGGLPEREEVPREAAQASGGYDIEQRLRAIVVGGLWPLLDALVRGDRGALACRVDEVQGLVALGLAEPVEQWPTVGDLERRRPVPLHAELTALAQEVHQQLAVLRHPKSDLPELGRTVGVVAGWHHVLLVQGLPADRGLRLLDWLRLGSTECRCYSCEAPATGLCRIAEQLALACSRHRHRPSWWGEGQGRTRVGVPNV